jgi:hypothetical protein
MNGKCDAYLCHQLDEEEFMSAADAYIPGDNKKDPVIGKMVKISEHCFVSFRDPDGDNHELNQNWKQLCNMAMPIVVNFQLSKIVMDGNWKTKLFVSTLEPCCLTTTLSVLTQYPTPLWTIMATRIWNSVRKPGAKRSQVS